MGGYAEETNKCGVVNPYHNKDLKTALVKRPIFEWEVAQPVTPLVGRKVSVLAITCVGEPNWRVKSEKRRDAEIHKYFTENPE